jgi:hypothetical protein
VAMFDHFHFRKVMQEITTKQPPLTLWYPGKPNAPTPWWKAYYDPKRIHMRDRLLFAGQPLPAGLAATKNVDWSAIDAVAAKAKPAKKKNTPKVARKTSAKKKPATKLKKVKKVKKTGAKKKKKTVRKKRRL